MNAVEIEAAVSDLALQPFDPAEFPFAFLAAFGNKATTIQRLRKGDSNYSDQPDGVLQRNHIHMAVAEPGKVGEAFKALRASPRNATAKVKFILATDGETLEAEDLASGETIAPSFVDFPDHFGFFLPLAGISTIKEIKDNPIDVRATGRLNKLYVELLRENPDWAKAERRPDMNHFMARLIFCFFAEDTDIFNGERLFTSTVEKMSERDGSNTAQVLEAIFQAMNIKGEERAAAKQARWTEAFPYVNGGLFGGSTDVPKFTKMARTYLLHAGGLNWKQINPDIFGSMIQAVADDEERGALGMHYTSVPNILKVLNPLFLDDLREQLEAAGDNKVKLLNLRRRMARIRVFDPACGSGNFLVIAYKQMRAIEWEINKVRGEEQLKSEIPISNFRGIELRDFPAEIARLALIIAEFQCDVLYRGQKEALSDVLPLDSQNWITCGNALRLDWLAICPPTGTGVKLVGDDLFNTPLDQAEIEFENEGGETFICGNPPYMGATAKAPKDATKEAKKRIKREEEIRKADMEAVLGKVTNRWKSLDYVASWFVKAADYGSHTKAAAAFVSTNSICQGQQVSILWPAIFANGHRISFAYTSFKWANLASQNAGVTVVIVGISSVSGNARLYETGASESPVVRSVDFIGPYLIPNTSTIVEKSSKPLNGLPAMDYGSKPADGGGLIIRSEAYNQINEVRVKDYVKKYLGTDEFLEGKQRYCLWIEKGNVDDALGYSFIRERVDQVREFRQASEKKQTRGQAETPYAFSEIRYGRSSTSQMPLIVPIHTSENRNFLPVGALDPGTVVSNAAYGLYGAPLWNMALIASRLHLVWIEAVCGQLETRYRYSNTLGWNTFPVQTLTERNKADLTECAKEILLAREAHFPATISNLYHPDKMPNDLRRAHEKSDETLERIYIGRRFKNDTERLEKLFDLYTKMTAGQAKSKRGQVK